MNRVGPLQTLTIKGSQWVNLLSFPYIYNLHIFLAFDFSLVFDFSLRFDFSL